jgi:hypothetical protein
MAFKPGVADQIRKQAERSGQPIPDRILNAPQLSVCLEFFFDSFWKLSSCRPSGMGPGPIPVTAILEYGRFHNCDNELMNDLIEYVMMLDQLYLTRENKKAKDKK